MLNNNISAAKIVELVYGCLIEYLVTIGTERFIPYTLSERFDHTK